MADGKYEPAGEGLPDGWLKECRPRKNRYGSRIKGDTFYIDPVNGYEFLSLKDVYRYLESGDISQCVTLPNKRKIEDLHTLHTAGDQSDHTGKPSDHTQLDTDVESNEYDIPRGTNTLRNVQREAVRVEASESKSIQSGSIEHTPGKAESVTRTGANAEQRPNEKKRKTKPVKGIATPLRSSPRLAALKISQEANNSAPRDELISTNSDITNHSQPKQAQKPRRKSNSSVLPERKDESSSEKFEDKYPAVPDQVQRASVPNSSGNAACQNALAGAPVLPQQIGQGGTSDNNNNMPGSALSSLFRHVWSDPCLVFAFRTLMGDIPVLNDTLAYRSSAYDGNRSYFLPPQNLNKGAAPNWSSSAYDGNRNHTQVDHVSLSMPRPSDKFYGSGWFPPQ